MNGSDDAFIYRMYFVILKLKYKIDDLLVRDRHSICPGSVYIMLCESDEMVTVEEWIAHLNE